jgi:phosphoglycerate dehydrogenase-like enzyme
MQPPFRIGITRDALDAQSNPIFDPAVLNLLDRPSVEWEFLDRFEPEITPETARRYDALCMMGGRLTRGSLAAEPLRLKIVARLGVGYDSVDVEACTERGVVVTITPDGVRRPVATTVVLFVLALSHKLLVKDRLTRAGRWAEKTNHMGLGLTGRTVGAIGLGNIGQELFRLLRPFDMIHVAYDPFANESVARELDVELCDLDAVLRRADFVSVMCPLNDETRGLIGAREIGLMKPSAYLINTARGPIVDEKALYEALSARCIAGAGLDVLEVEPAPSDNPLFALDNVIVTPHALCFTDECLAGLARSAFEAVLAVASGQAPKFMLNGSALARRPAAGSGS